MKSYQKISKTIEKRNIFIDNNTGEIKDDETELIELKYITSKSDEFMLLYTSLLGIFIKELTLPDIKVYSYLLLNYNSGSKIGLIKGLKEDICIKTNLKLGTINNSISNLSKLKLIVSFGKSVYELNPRYAFKGSSKDRNKRLNILLEHCPDC